MGRELNKNYDPHAFESRIYADWMEKGYFKAEVDKNKTPFCVVMPPPNVTGVLHMGHALDETLQDILIRWKRMSGYSALWLPGTDHAAIATEAKIVAAMAEEGLTKEMLGREKFMERAWQWKEQYGGRIIEQLKKLGSSCDWDRERFTMDEGCNKAVKEVFVRYYEEGLIYRGERMINWCPHCRTSLSDAEVTFEEQAGHFWHLRYPLADGSGYLELATTRPETLLGDTAVAVNPNDDRYRHLVGKMLILPLVGREIPVVADDYVDMEFGTGVVKITPAHDPNDFEVGQRHDLPILNVMTDDAKITDEYPAYAGMDRYEARKKIVADLEAGGFLVKVEDHSHNVGTCYRCGKTVEPRISTQWFVKMKPLAQPAIDAVKNGETRFVPERFEKIYFHWLENIRDWCISRQIWWGHQIPAFYCDDCGEMIVTKEDSAVCPKCGKPMRQDPDTLDTWFSSALWPFSTLGWPDQTEDLDYFYPTSTLVTGYDIIPFWVMRMMFSGIACTGKAPFDTVLIHGLVRDAQGRKMSKSLGNGIDPLQVIDEYGADALRMTLVSGNAPGNDMRFSTDKIERSRNFCNKIWNATRYVIMNMESADLTVAPGAPALEDKWILSKLNRTIASVTASLEKYELGIAVDALYSFFWNDFCDWYIEMTKERLRNGNPTEKATAIHTLRTVLVDALKLLHPFMPFITEELFGAIQETEPSIMISEWPKFSDERCFEAEEKSVECMMECIRKIRELRVSMNVPASKKTSLLVSCENQTAYDSICSSKLFFARLANAPSADDVQVQMGKENIPDGMVPAIATGVTIFIPLGELVDIKKEIERLEGERTRIESEIARVNGMLSNPNFCNKAPAQKVEAEREKLVGYEAKYQDVNEQIAKLKAQA